MIIGPARSGLLPWRSEAWRPSATPRLEQSRPSQATEASEGKHLCEEEKEEHLFRRRPGFDVSDEDSTKTKIVGWNEFRDHHTMLESFFFFFCDIYSSCSETQWEACRSTTKSTTSNINDASSLQSLSLVREALAMCIVVHHGFFTSSSVCQK